MRGKERDERGNREQEWERKGKKRRGKEKKREKERRETARAVHIDTYYESVVRRIAHAFY